MKNTKKTTERYFSTLSKKEQDINAWFVSKNGEPSKARVNAFHLRLFQNKTPNPKVEE